MADEEYERGLAYSVLIFDTLKTIVGKRGDDDTVQVSVKEIKKLRKAAAKMNQSFSRMVQRGFDRENRLSVEKVIMRETMRREVIDREANRARVFQRMRAHKERTSSYGAAPSSSSFESPVDHAIWSVSKTDEAIAALSPTGGNNMQGSSIIGVLEKHT